MTLNSGSSADAEGLMKSRTDPELLRDYAQHGGEAAFAELARRHMNLVYSAAMRMILDRQIANDVTQCVFIVLAQNAGKLANRTVLSGWLHRTTRNLAAKAVRAEVRRRLREQEAATMNSPCEPSDPSWQAMAPLLDDGLSRLPDRDRDALFLRYFEHKTAREVAEKLGLGEEAAQKRVRRAVERLRAFFVKRGVAVSTGGLVAALTTQAVQAAPAGMETSISAVAAAAGSTMAGAGLLGIAKAITMTTAQKLIVGASLSFALGAGIYETQRTARVEMEKQTLLRQREPLARQIDQLRQERDRASAGLADLQGQIDQLRRDTEEARALRKEVADLRNRTRELAQLKTANSQLATAATMTSLAARVNQLKQQLEQTPGKKIPELQLADENDWIEAAMAVKADTEEDLRKGLSRLRTLAKDKLAPVLARGLRNYAQANDGQLPPDFAQLKPYFEAPVDDAILQRYALTQAGNIKDLKPGQAAVQEIGRTDAFDTLHGINPDGYFRSEPMESISKADGRGMVKTTSTFVGVP